MRDLKYLNKFFWKYRLLLAIGFIFILIANLFALYPAEFVRKAFDHVLEYKNTNTTSIQIHSIILKYSTLIIVFAMLKGVFMYFMRQTIIVMSRKIEFDLKNEIYTQYQKLSLNFYKKNRTGDLMNRISEDVSRVRMYVGPALMYTINIVILFSLVITKMLSINTTLTYYVLIPLPILAFSVYHVSHKINKRSEAAQEQLSKLTTIAQETFSGISITKAFNNENNVSDYFYKSCEKYSKRNLQLAKIDAIFFPLIIILIGTSTILTIYIGGIESYKGNISTGNIAEFIIYINMLAWPVASVGWVTSLVQRSAASQNRINNFLNQNADVYNNPKALKITNNIEFKNVSLKYTDTQIKGVNNISFKINQGETLGIFGETGSGKTTIANLICRLYDVTEGEILFENDNIKDLDLYQLRTSIGYVPQDGYLFSGSIKDNISFSDDNLNNEKIINAAKAAEIWDEINLFEKGINTVIGERGIQLSGGQRQRLAIARTFYKNPDLFILDDCLSAVDANKEKNILNNLKKKTRNKTTIIISHRINTIKEADLIIVLNKGKIISKGTHEELLKKKSFYYKINNSQSNSNLIKI